MFPPRERRSRPDRRGPVRGEARRAWRSHRSPYGSPPRSASPRRPCDRHHRAERKHKQRFDLAIAEARCGRHDAGALEFQKMPQSLPPFCPLCSSPVTHPRVRLRQGLEVSLFGESLRYWAPFAKQPDGRTDCGVPAAGTGRGSHHVPPCSCSRTRSLSGNRKCAGFPLILLGVAGIEPAHGKCCGTARVIEIAMPHGVGSTSDASAPIHAGNIPDSSECRQPFTPLVPRQCLERQWGR